MSGHNANLDRVRFHPHESNLLCTSAEEGAIRLWDVRANHGKNFAKIELTSNAVSAEWHPSSSKSCQYICVSQSNNYVQVFDIRKMQNVNGSGGSGSRGARSAPQSAAPTKALRSFDLNPDILRDSHFSPSGTHLVVATKSPDGMGQLKHFLWDRPEKDQLEMNSVTGHIGSIYTIRFSPDGTKLATGGHDALVGLWDVKSMICKSTISRNKFIRSVSYSYDSKILACCGDEDGIVLANCQTGTQIDKFSLQSSRKNAPGGGGSDEIAFHPKAYVLACARIGSPSDTKGAHVTIAKLDIAADQ